MDAFYASVELLRYPELRGKPLVIGGRRRTADDGGDPDAARLQPAAASSRPPPTKRASFGLHSGMGLMKAAKLAPDALLLPADFDEYRRYSRLFKDAVRAVAPQIEDRGIDEIYIDLTELVAPSAADGAPDPGCARAWSRRTSSAPCARRPGSRARSASRPTSCCPRSPPSSTSPAA